jgi:hypothetical protein
MWAGEQPVLSPGVYVVQSLLSPMAAAHMEEFVIVLLRLRW